MDYYCNACEGPCCRPQSYKREDFCEDITTLKNILQDTRDENEDLRYEIVKLEQERDKLEFQLREEKKKVKSSRIF